MNAKDLPWQRKETFFNCALPTKGKHFYSSSESEEEEEAHKKFNIKIKPLQAKDVLKSAATVDELKASIGNIALSPSPVVSPRCFRLFSQLQARRCSVGLAPSERGALPSLPVLQFAFTSLFIIILIYQVYVEAIMRLQVELRCIAVMFPVQNVFKIPFLAHKTGQQRSE